MELINEAQIGATKDTACEKAVGMNFSGECSVVGLYLAMARKAGR